jgi:hypothetical protein
VNARPIAALALVQLNLQPNSPKHVDLQPICNTTPAPAAALRSIIPR